ncbi:hypothetical protein V8C37DRAFT_391479 [Trichoderma ceciliae]
MASISMSSWETLFSFCLSFWSRTVTLFLSLCVGRYPKAQPFSSFFSSFSFSSLSLFSIFGCCNFTNPVTEMQVLCADRQSVQYIP